MGIRGGRKGDLPRFGLQKVGNDKRTEQGQERGHDGEKEYFFSAEKTILSVTICVPVTIFLEALFRFFLRNAELLKIEVLFRGKTFSIVGEESA